MWRPSPPSRARTGRSFRRSRRGCSSGSRSQRTPRAPSSASRLTIDVRGPPATMPTLLRPPLEGTRLLPPRENSGPCAYINRRGAHGHDRGCERANQQVPKPSTPLSPAPCPQVAAHPPRPPPYPCMHASTPLYHLCVTTVSPYSADMFVNVVENVLTHTSSGCYRADIFV